MLDHLVGEVSRADFGLLRTSRSIVGRLQRQALAVRPPRTRTRTLAVVPIHKNIDVTWFAEALARSLSAFGSLLRLSPTKVDAALGRDGIAQSSPRDEDEAPPWAA